MDLNAIPAPAWGFLGLLFGSFLGPVFQEIIRNRTADKTSQASMLKASGEYFTSLLEAQRKVIKELEDQIRELARKVEDQSRLIEEMSAHIASLEDQIKGLGATPVQRKRQKIDPAVA